MSISILFKATVSDNLRARLEGLPQPLRNIAWKGQVRRCAPYRGLQHCFRVYGIVENSKALIRFYEGL